MDTVYYTLHTKKVKVSGGADLLMLTPSAVAAPAAAPAGEVLDFVRCRQKLETKAAWKDLARAAEDVRAESGWQEDDGQEAAGLPAAAVRERRMERANGWMELCASAAVILVSLSAAAAFFSLV